jgi:hypothetical protein
MTPLRPLRIATLLALAGTGMVLASCSSLFGFDEYDDATTELCDLAQKCYGFSACDGHVGPKLDGASAPERSDWLAAIPTKACLDSCAKSRKCLNLAPVCSPLDAPCEREEQCCGFLSGQARCRAKLSGPAGADAGTDAPMTCCLPDGVQTQVPGECCSGVYNPKNKACGQTVCRPSLSDCTDDLQCCSGRCDPVPGDPSARKCSEEQCLPLETPCAQGDTCCDGAECLSTTGTCGFPEVCRTLRAPCDTQGAKGGACCDGLTCKAAKNNHPTTELWDGLCQDGNACMPKGYACAETTDCCADEPLECRDGECRGKCAAVETPCSDNGDCCSGKCEVDPLKGPVCKCAQIYCETSTNPMTDCCSGICVGGVCTAPCAETTVCHDECIPGPPLVQKDLSSCKQVDPTCVAKVCAADAYCCCVEWDATCVKQAVTGCGAPASACN